MAFSSKKSKPIKLSPYNLPLTRVRNREEGESFIKEHHDILDDCNVWWEPGHDIYANLHRCLVLAVFVLESTLGSWTLWFGAKLDIPEFKCCIASNRFGLGDIHQDTPNHHKDWFKDILITLSPVLKKRKHPNNSSSYSLVVTPQPQLLIKDIHYKPLFE
ncbi:hypothetical protein DVH24_037725 [Malus domestica]|uniref:Uncharacterized protein n=1 Tax=Malus domestica TaxID=3750 RepID=A0A498JYM4_MALDO|nr:hypothetical protein DVH24_037725 [Malus domestica]